MSSNEPPTVHESLKVPPEPADTKGMTNSTETITIEQVREVLHAGGIATPRFRWGVGCERNEVDLTDFGKVRVFASDDRTDARARKVLEAAGLSVEREVGLSSFVVEEPRTRPAR